MKTQCRLSLACASVIVACGLCCTAFPILEIGTNKMASDMNLFVNIMRTLEKNGHLNENALSSLVESLPEKAVMNKPNADVKDEEIFLSKLSGISFGTGIAALIKMLKPDFLELLTDTVLPQNINEFAIADPFIAPLYEELPSAPFPGKFDAKNSFVDRLPGILSSKQTTSTTTKPLPCLVISVDFGRTLDTSTRNRAYLTLASEAVLVGLSGTLGRVCETNDMRCKYLYKFEGNTFKGEDTLEVTYGIIMFNILSDQWQLFKAQPGTELEVLAMSDAPAGTPAETSFPWAGANMGRQTVQRVTCIR